MSGKGRSEPGLEAQGLDSEDIQQEGRGRTAQRRRALDIAETAKRLAELRPVEIAALPLSPALREEVLLAHETQGNTSKRRQIKYLAGLLREDDDAVELANAFLDGQLKQRNKSARAFQELERWRERLLAETGAALALEELKSQRPELDFEELQRHVKRYRELGDKAAYRAIFKLLAQESPS
ncbi:MAG: ribosome biogenesis factor YjgA [Myxococcota bacterium]|nr:ribosome biogenesis factor YjgA [Myxococcota bacterium]